jgi:hypothetical protein
VIRSVAGCRPDSIVSVLVGEPFDSNTARMAIRARADSEMPRLAANSANCSFSVGVGRAVIEGLREVGMLLLTRKTSFVQQNADTSLSCHHNNTNPKTCLRDSNNGADVGHSRGKKQLQ